MILTLQIHWNSYSSHHYLSSGESKKIEQKNNAYTEHSREKSQQKTRESGFCNVNTETVQINSSSPHFGGEKQHQKTKETIVHKKST